MSTEPVTPAGRSSLPGGVWLPVLILVIVLVVTFLLLPADSAPFVYKFF